VAAVAGTRFSMVSGGLACVVGVMAACAAFPSFRRYQAAVGPSSGTPAVSPAALDAPVASDLALLAGAAAIA